MAIEVEDYYARYGPMVLRRCRRLLGGDEAAARDAMHDVFVRLLQNEERLTSEAPSALLYRMATNVCLNRLRTRRRKPETRDDVLLSEIAALEDQEARTIAGRVLDVIFGREQPSTRTIATYHLVDGMTHEEIAAELGMSVSGVRKRLRTLKARAREFEGVSP
ncbi:sigma-70 family RNA polymerase sigma factor [Myxococcota bacterium]|nr:sigma-70 family RNA polymerase sigma factor [Myxococcota bacterium]